MVSWKTMNWNSPDQGRLIRASLLFLGFASWRVVACGQESLTPEVVARTKAAVVYVKTGRGDTQQTGSGFVIRVSKETAFVATNQHVVDKPRAARFGRPRGGPFAPPPFAGFPPPPKAGDSRVEVVFHSGDSHEKTLPAEIVVTTEEPDLAILKVAGIPSDIQGLDCEKTVELIETTPVFVVGFPFGEDLSLGSGNPAVTIGKGTISSLRRNAAGRIVRVQIDGSLNPGNSGGPIIDGQGNLLGIAVAAIRGSNIGLAIPTTALSEMLAGTVGRPNLLVYQSNPGSPPRIQVELPVTDPLGKLGEVKLQYVEGLAPSEVGGRVQSILSDGAGGVVPVEVDGSKGTAELPIEVPPPGETRQVTVQALLIDAEGNQAFLPAAVLAIQGADLSRHSRPNGNPSARNSRRKPRTADAESPAAGFPSAAPADDESSDAPTNKVAENPPQNTPPAKGGFPAFPPSMKSQKTGPRVPQVSTPDAATEKAVGAKPESMWVSRLDQMESIPEDRLTGQIDGRPFVLEQALLQQGKLKLRQASDVVEIQITLWGEEDSDVAGKTFVADGKPGLGKPQALVSMKPAPEQAPRRLKGEFRVRIVFGDYDSSRHIQSGRIYLCGSDSNRSWVVGAFEASVP